MAVIDESVVRVLPDFRDFRPELKRKLKEAVAGIAATVKVKLVADVAGFRASAQRELKKVAPVEFKVKLVADTSSIGSAKAQAVAARKDLGDAVTGEAVAQARRVERAAGDASVKESATQAKRIERERVRAVKDAQREAFASYSPNIRIAGEVERAARRAEKQALIEQKRANREAEQEAERHRRAMSQSFKMPQLISFGQQGIKPMNLLYGTLVALSPVLLSVASSAAEAGTSVAALGSAMYGGALAATGLISAFTGVLGAWKLSQSLQKAQQGQAAKSAKANLDTQASIRNAYNSMLNASQRVKDAQAAEKKATEDVTKAYAEAAQKVKDLRLELADLAEQQRGNALDVEQAKQDAAAAHNSFFTSDLQKRQADQAVRDAQQKGRDIAAQIEKDRKELAQRTKSGASGSPEVVAALDAQAKAQAELTAAIRERKNATLDYKAAQTKSNAAVGKALAQDGQLQAALALLSPQARELYNWLQASTDAFYAFRRGAEAAILPGFLSFLEAATGTNAKGKRIVKGKTAADIFASGVRGVGREISSATAALGKMVASRWFKADLQKLNKDNEKSFHNVNHAILALFQPLTRIIVGASPLLVRLTGYIDKLAIRFADWMKQFSDDDIAGYFKRAGDELAKWWKIAVNLGSIVMSLFTASLPSGQGLVARLQEFTASIAEWARSPQGQKKLRDFFDWFKNLPYGRITKIVTGIAGLVGFFKAANALRSLNPLYQVFTIMATKFPDTTFKLLDWFSSGLVTVLGWMEKHPKATKDFIALAAAVALYAKTASLFGKMPKGGLLSSLIGKIPGVGKAGGILGELFGERGSSATNPLYVVVVGGTTPGETSSGGAPVPAGGGGGEKGAKGGKGSKIRGNVTKYGGMVLAEVNPIVAVAVGTGMVMDMLGQPFEWDPVKDAKDSWASFKQTMKEEWDQDAGWWNQHMPKFLQLPGVSGPPKPPSKAVAAQTVEGKALSAFNAEKGDDRLHNMIMAKTDPGFQGWVAARKASVQALFEQEAKTKGAATAQADLRKENAKSITVAAQLLTQYGMGAKAAQAYAQQLFTLPPLIDAVRKSGKPLNQLLDGTNTTTSELATCTNNWGLSLDNAAGTAAAKIPTFASLNTTVDKATGEKKLVLTVDGEKQVFDNLFQAMTYQRALQTNSSLASAAQQVKVDQDMTRRGVYRAMGGVVRGPGTETSDDIPAMLSDYEYVQRASAVRKYGVGFMDAVNSGAFPKALAQGFAKGGLVTWPFKTDISRTFIPQLDTGAGVVSGDAKVAAIAEATARSMGASDKQLIALIEAGLVESGLRNLKHGDRDSVGFLQQRPSQGWGSVRQIMNVAYATRKFIEKAMKVDDSKLDAGQLAQKVQVSAFPARYAARYADAVAVLNQLPPYVMGGVGFGSQAGGLGWQWQLAALAKDGFVFHPSLGQTTGGGHAKDSWHYRGRAVDLSPPSMAVFNDIKSHWGANTKELIYGPAVIGIKDGKPYNYGPKLNAEHMNHVHWAYAKGGLVRAQKFDTGGPLKPGVTLAVNGTGKTETVRTAEQEKALQSGRFDPRDMALLAMHIANAVTGQHIRMDGRRVAETVRSYDYLPRGAY